MYSIQERNRVATSDPTMSNGFDRVTTDAAHSSDRHTSTGAVHDNALILSRMGDADARQCGRMRRPGTGTVPPCHGRTLTFFRLCAMRRRPPLSHTRPIRPSPIGQYRVPRWGDAQAHRRDEWPSCIVGRTAMQDMRSIAVRNITVISRESKFGKICGRCLFLFLGPNRARARLGYCWRRRIGSLLSSVD